MDLDQSGLAYQTANIYLGPTLGWVRMQIGPVQNITSVGTYTLDPNSSRVLVNVAGAVTINIPSVSSWMKEAFQRPATAFDRSIWIKDFGGNAAAHPITVHPFGSDKVDNRAIDYTIIQAYQLIRLYPLNDLTGWFIG